MAMEEGGYVCDAVDVSVRDRDGQDLVDSRQPPDLSAEDREMWDKGMIDAEAKARSSGFNGWATCWWRDDRLDVMVFDSERSRLLALVGGLGFGCFALPGGRMQIPYVHGDDWAVLPGWAETPFEDIEGIAHAVGGHAVNTRCADLSAAVESWEGSYEGLDAVSADELRPALGE